MFVRKLFSPACLPYLTAYLPVSYLPVAYPHNRLSPILQNEAKPLAATRQRWRAIPRLLANSRWLPLPQQKWWYPRELASSSHSLEVEYDSWLLANSRWLLLPQLKWWYPRERTSSSNLIEAAYDATSISRRRKPTSAVPVGT